MDYSVKFCTTPDGVRLAYSVRGEGSPLLIVPSWLSHLELDQQALVPPAFFDTLASRHTLVRYDKRGMGLSSRNLTDYSLEAQVADLHAIVLHLDLRGVSLFGSSQGGTIAIAYAAEHPERIARLILFGTYHYVPNTLRDALGSAVPLVRTDWTGLGTAPLLEWLVPGATTEQRDLFARYQREAANGHDAAAILEALLDYRVTPFLERIRVPTLVMHRRDDRVVSADQGREIAATIPDARFVALEGQVHLPYWGDTQPLLQAIEDFLWGAEAAHIPHLRDAAMCAVLFTDLVGHTEMMSRLGDERGRELLRDHERITREILKRHGGEEVKTMGDGFMASFGSVTRAMRCAIALQRAFADFQSSRGESMSIRIGLDAGEPIAEDGDLFGATVIMASRVCAEAGPGEILVPEPVRHLLSGKGFVFAERGEFLPKGFEDRVRLFEVRWRE